MMRGVVCAFVILILATILGVGVVTADGCPEVTVPIIQESFSNWPPPGWSVTGTQPNDCPWDNNTNLDLPNYTAGVGYAATASSLNCADTYGNIRELMGPPLTVIGYPASLDMSFLTDWEPYCGSAGARTETACQQGRLVFHLDHQTDSYPFTMPGSYFNGPVSVHLASYPAYNSFRVGFQYQGNTSYTDEWWQIDNVKVTATYELCYFPWGFQDDYQRSEVCVIWDLTQSTTFNSPSPKPPQGPTIGAFAYRVLKGTGAGNIYYGWANVQYGPGYIRMIGGPNQGSNFNLIYYTNIYRATATFSYRPDSVGSTLNDLNTQNDETSCGRNGKG